MREILMRISDAAMTLRGAAVSLLREASGSVRAAMVPRRGRVALSRATFAGPQEPVNGRGALVTASVVDLGVFRPALFQAAMSALVMLSLSATAGAQSVSLIASAGANGYTNNINYGEESYQSLNLPFADQTSPFVSVAGGTSQSSVIIRSDGSIQCTSVSSSRPAPVQCDIFAYASGSVGARTTLEITLSARSGNPTPTPPYFVEFVTSSSLLAQPLDTPTQSGSYPTAQASLAFSGSPLRNLTRHALGPDVDQQADWVTNSLSNNSGDLVVGTLSTSRLWRVPSDRGCNQPPNASEYGGTASATLVFHGLRARDAAGILLRILCSAAGISRPLPDLNDQPPVCPLVTLQPQATAACVGGTASLSLAVQGAAPLTHQWQIQTSPPPNETWLTLTTDPVPLPCGATSYATATPSNASTVSIFVRSTCPATPGTPARWPIRCIVSNTCGSVTSNTATLTICPADFNCDGGVDGDDVIAFFGSWDNGELAADVTGDGGVDGDDVIAFFEAWDSGC